MAHSAVVSYRKSATSHDDWGMGEDLRYPQRRLASLCARPSMTGIVEEQQVGWGVVLLQKVDHLGSQLPIRSSRLDSARLGAKMVNRGKDALQTGEVVFELRLIVLPN